MKLEGKTIELSTAIAIAAFILSIGSMVWVGGFRMSELIHEVKDLQDDVRKVDANLDEGFKNVDHRFEKVESRLESIERELHHHDLRINTLEQLKP